MSILCYIQSIIYWFLEFLFIYFWVGPMYFLSFKLFFPPVFVLSFCTTYTGLWLTSQIVVSKFLFFFSNNFSYWVHTFIVSSEYLTAYFFLWFLVESLLSMFPFLVNSSPFVLNMLRSDVEDISFVVKITRYP